MCCFALLFSALGPRFAILAMWLFGSRVDAAFDSPLWPLLGLAVAPWTTLMYLVMWSRPDGVTGGEWIIVGLAVAADIATYAAKPAQRQYASAGAGR